MDHALELEVSNMEPMPINGLGPNSLRRQAADVFIKATSPDTEVIIPADSFVLCDRAKIDPEDLPDSVHAEINKETTRLSAQRMTQKYIDENTRKFRLEDAVNSGSDAVQRQAVFLASVILSKERNISNVLESAIANGNSRTKEEALESGVSLLKSPGNRCGLLLNVFSYSGLRSQQKALDLLPLFLLDEKWRLNVLKDAVRYGKPEIQDEAIRRCPELLPTNEIRHSLLSTAARDSEPDAQLRALFMN